MAFYGFKAGKKIKRSTVQKITGTKRAKELLKLLEKEGSSRGKFLNKAVTEVQSED